MSKDNLIDNYHTNGELWFLSNKVYLLKKDEKVVVSFDNIFYQN